MSDPIWPTRTLGELFDIGAGKAMSPAARLGERTYPFLRTANVFWGRLDLATLDTMNFSEDEIEFKSLKRGDLLVCEGGDIGRSAVWSGEVEKCGFQNHIHRLRPKSAETLSTFVMYYLQAGFTQLGVYEGAGNKTTIPNLSRGRLAALLVPTPPRPEQETIAAILRKIQRAVAIQEQLVATARELKQSAMRQLFTRGLRGEAKKDTDIGPIPKAWQVIQLNQAYETQLGKMLSQKARVSDSPAPYLRNKNVQWGRIDLSDIAKMDFDAQEMDKFRLRKGDLLICEGGVIGRAAIWEGIIEPCYYQKALHRARPISGQSSNEFLAFWFMYAFEVANIYRFGGASSTIEHLPAVQLKRLPIPHPPISEQREIASILHTIDRKISLHERKRDTLQDLFKTMLYQLMTAQIRVDKLDIDTSEVAQ
jgi:type I restriction enzyme S subunit